MSWNNYTPPNDSTVVGPAEAVSQVKDTMQRMSTQVDRFTGQLQTNLNALAAITVEAVGPVPDVTIPRDNKELAWTTTPLSVESLGDVDVELPADPGPLKFTTIAPMVEIGQFNPGVTISVPAPPPAIAIGGAPARPTIDTSVSTPTKPTLVMPVLDAFDAINIPTFTFPTLPEFTEDAPEFTAAMPNVAVAWAEPVYASENFDLMLTTVKRVLAGGTGLPAVIEAQLFERARGREDITARKAVGEAFNVFAAKGFTMPPGMLVEQVNAVLEQNQLQVNTLSREILIKVADVEIENMRFAVQQGLAAENILFNIFNNANQRGFEIAKFTVESQLALYSAQVSLFNAATSAYQTKASVYKIRLDAELAQLEVYKTQLEGQRIISEVNQQRVQTFMARIQALNSQVEIYKAEMEAAKIRSDLARTQIEAYKADVSAFAELIGAEKIRFDAYKTQVEGEVAKAGIVDSSARAFATMVNAEDTKANIRIKTGQLEIEQAQAATQRFVASVEFGRSQLTAKVAKTEALARLEGLRIQDRSVQSDANRAKAEATIRIGEQQLQSNLAAVNAKIKLYEVSITKVLEEAKLKATSMQEAGRMAATLAGGAMAAQHVQASISASSSESTSSSTAKSESASESWNYTPTTTN